MKHFLYFLIIIYSFFFIFLLANIFESNVTLLWAGEEGWDFYVWRDLALEWDVLICNGSLLAHLNIYNNKKLLLSVKLIGILEYYTGDETYCQDSNCKLLYKCDDNKIIKKGLFSLIYRLISSGLNRTSPFCKKD